MVVNFDKYGNVEPSKIYLATPDKQIVCALNGVIENSVNMTLNANNTSEISFEVDKYISQYNSQSKQFVKKQSNGYDKLGWLMKIYVTNIGWFIMSEPSTNSESDKETKTITAESAEIELIQTDLKGFKVNCGTTDSIEMLVEDNVTNIDGVEFAKEQIKFCNKDKTELSLLHILFDGTGWSIGYVDQIPKKYSHTSTNTFIQDSIDSLKHSQSLVDQSTDYGKVLYEKYQAKIDMYESILQENPEQTSITYDEYVLLEDEVGKFDIDNKSKYALITQDIQQYYQCIFDFDFDKYVVDVYRVENIGNDTNINIGFRNLQDSNSIDVSESDIFTKYYVSNGDDLGITYVNPFGNYIYNLSYYANTNYMPYELVQKYNLWQSQASDARKTLIDLSRMYNKQLDVVSELYNRLPLDDCSTDWATLSDEQLTTSYNNYKAQLAGYAAMYPTYDEFGNIVKDDEGNIVIDEEAIKNSVDYNDYIQIKDTIIVNIEIEMENRELPTSIGEQEYTENYKTNWDLYGLDELEVNLENYKNIVQICKSGNYDIPYEEYLEYSNSDPEKYPPHTEDMHVKTHSEYLDAAYQLNESNFDSCQYAYNLRKKEIELAEKVLNGYNSQRTELINSFDIDSWGKQSDDNPQDTSFTQSEKFLLNSLLYEADYTNENIITTDYDTIDNIIDTQDQLYQAAVEDLAIYSQPQYTYDTSVDNFLSQVKYQSWSEEIDLFDFLWVGIRDDYVVKLRLISISFNPMLYDNNLQLTFSNMIKSPSARNDFISLLNQSGGASKNSRSGIGSSTNSDDNTYYQITSGILRQIINSSLFQNSIQNAIDGSLNNFTGNSITIGNLVTEMINASDAHIENGYFQYLESQLIVSDKIVGQSGEFKDLSAFVAMIDNLIAGNVSAELGHIISLTAENVNIDEAVIRDLIAANITVSMLKAGTISSNKFEIASDDGGMSIIGNTMQFKDKNGKIRIQIGRDSNDDFTFVLYDSTGSGVLIDSTGIKPSAISDGLIQTDMVADNAITEDKIDKTNILEWTDDNGDKIFQVGNMYFGDDKFEVSYTQTVEKVDETYEAVEDLTKKIATIELMGEQIFKSIQGVVSPETITVTAVCRNGASVGKWYIDNVENTSYVSSDKFSITIPYSVLDDKNSCTIKVTDSTETLYDLHTLYIISDSTGADGQAAISVVITSSNGNTFNENTNIQSTTCTCNVFEGVTEITPNSYNWLTITDDSSEWQSIGSTKSIQVPIDKSIIRRRLRCDVDINVGGG